MKVDRYFGLAVSILALLFLTLAVPSISEEWKSAAGTQYFIVGPRLFPYIAGGLCLLLGTLLVIRPEGRTKLSGLAQGDARLRVMMSLILSLGYAVLLDILGFTVTTFVALFLFFVVFGERRWFIILPMAAGVAILTKYLFLKLFMLELPPGMFELPI